jgi:S-layer protein
VNDARTTTVPGQNANTVTIVDDALTTLKVSGNQSIVITHGTGTALTSVDATGLTLGSISFAPSGALQYATSVKGSLLGGDTLDFSASLAAVTITETAGANTIKGSSTIGSTLNGGTGIDTITGGAGADTVSAGTGNDLIYAKAGADIINVGAGTDSVFYDATLQTKAETASWSTYATATSVATADKITGMGNGDLIDTTTAFAVVTAGAVQQTAFLVANTTDKYALMSGNYDATAGTFIAGTASTTNNDYIFQWADGTRVSSVVLVDVWTTGSTVVLTGVAGGTDTFTLSGIV